MHLSSQRFLAVIVLSIIGSLCSQAHADGGWYLGGSIGLSYLEADIPGSNGDVFGFDESDEAWKVYGGYIVDLPLIDLGVEGGYVNLANPSARFPGFRAEVDATGFNLWGIAGVDIGPVGVFGKLGTIVWDLDGRTSGVINQRFNDSGTDVGYGLGAKFMLFSLEMRAEYERYEVEDGIDMISVGANWVF